MKQNVLFILAILLLSGSLVYIGQQLTNSGSNPMGMTNTISVAGEGKTKVSPDTMLISLSATELSKTTEEAQKIVNTKLAQLRTILQTFEIPDNKITTQQLSVYPEYDRSDGKSTIIGYRATQTLDVRVMGDKYEDKGAQIIDEASKIGGISVYQTSFIVDDMDAALLVAREAAFADAKTKAQQLADLADVDLGDPVTITDQSYQNYPTPPIMYARAEMAMDGGKSVGSTQVNPGETEITVNLQVMFALE